MGNPICPTPTEPDTRPVRSAAAGGMAVSGRLELRIDSVIGVADGYLRWISAGHRSGCRGGDVLPCRVLAGSPPHSQGGQGEGAEEYDDSDDQQVKQAFGDHADDAQRDRYDY